MEASSDCMLQRRNNHLKSSGSGAAESGVVDPWSAPWLVSSCLRDRVCLSLSIVGKEKPGGGRATEVAGEGRQNRVA